VVDADTFVGILKYLNETTAVKFTHNYRGDSTKSLYADSGIFSIDIHGHGTSRLGDGCIATGAGSVSGGTRSVSTGDAGIAFGLDDSAVGNVSVALGENNNAATLGSSVTGGLANNATGSYAHIGGGTTNYTGAAGAAVVGGYSDSASGVMSIIGGGQLNKASGRYSSVVAGKGNVSSDSGAFIGGGYGNTASGKYSSIGGGYSNTTSGRYTSVVGGISNSALSNSGVVCGGDSNVVNYPYAFVGGGVCNRSSASHAAVVGGDSNEAYGTASFVGGGKYNAAWGSYSVVPGGLRDSAIHNYSMAFGDGAKTTRTNQVIFDWTTNGNLTVDGTINADSFIGDYTGSRPFRASSIDSCAYFVGNGAQATLISTYIRVGRPLNTAVDSGNSVQIFDFPASDTWLVTGIQVVFDSVTSTGAGNDAAMYFAIGTTANAAANATLSGGEINLLTNKALDTYINGYSTVMDDQGSALTATGNKPMFYQINGATPIYLNWGGTAAADGALGVRCKVKLFVKSGKLQPY
jgi:hypothetical protein